MAEGACLMAGNFSEGHCCHSRRSPAGPARPHSSRQWGNPVSLDLDAVSLHGPILVFGFLGRASGNGKSLGDRFANGEVVAPH